MPDLVRLSSERARQAAPGLLLPRGSTRADVQRALYGRSPRRVPLRHTQEGRTSWPTSRQQSSADATIGNSANARRRRAPVIPRPESGTNAQAQRGVRGPKREEPGRGRRRRLKSVRGRGVGRRAVLSNVASRSPHLPESMRRNPAPFCRPTTRTGSGPEPGLQTHPRNLVERGHTSRRRALAFASKQQCQAPTRSRRRAAAPRALR